MLNRVTLMGRLTKDPEVRYTKGAEPKAVASFSLAVDRNYKGQDGERQTDFFDLVAWRHKADFVQNYFKKGQLVCVEGHLQREIYEDREHVKRTVYKVVVENCYFCDSKKQDSPAPANKPAAKPPSKSKKDKPQTAQPAGGGLDPNDDDLPF
jgi:single-strand DNA-binding protein